VSRTAFVTGASGFVGAHLARHLVAEGWDVRALRHRSAPPEGVVEVAGDLGDIAAFAEALGGADAVFHCGALLAPVDDEREAERINHRATVILAEAARDARVGSFVFVSSIAAVGFRERAGLLGPDARCTPTTAYGRSKRAAERDLLRLPAGGMRVVVVRPPTVYGPGDRRNFLALARAVDTGLFPIPGRGDNRMSFCHVDNLVRALAEAPDARDLEGIVHVADPAPVTLRETVRTLADALGRRPLPLPFPMPVARAAATACELLLRGRAPLDRDRLRTITADCALDTSHLSERGFVPPVPFARGVADTVGWYRRQGLLRGGP